MSSVSMSVKPSSKVQSSRAPAFEAPRSKSVPNTPEGWESLLDWATRQAKCTAAELHVILEATGPYHEPLALALVATGARVSIINPAQFRDFVKGLAVRTKTDPRDGVMLAR